MDISSPVFGKRQINTVKVRANAATAIFLSSLTLALFGCGAPGEPIPPSPPIPTTIADLSAHQVGDGVMLSFTMPTKSVLGDKLVDVPTMEILRGSMSADGTPDEKSIHVVDTVPGAVMKAYIRKGTVQFVDPVAPAEIRAEAGATVVYRVRARVSDKKTSGSSNEVLLKLIPVAAPVENLRANLTEDGIELGWAAPTQTSGGEAISGSEQYHVYRGEVEAKAAQDAAKDLSHVVWKSPLVQIANTKIPEYRDSGFDYGKTYVYVVRTTLGGVGEGENLESNDSHSAVLTPVDTFPPAAPRGIVAAVLPGSEAGKLVVDLSWSINVEADLAGYHVYRSEKQGERGKLVTAEMLLTPAYRDTSVATGQQFWYSVTAVDRAGNESGPSEQILVEITQPSS
jgi:hypothetical protein